MDGGLGEAARGRYIGRQRVRGEGCDGPKTERNTTHLRN